ncbi:CrcB family protein [Halobacillus kuroshimensis]|uniref:Fluoride-specific ion channel FluC n=1 Tax=Halobacillus kuroshimensis TaxID=302481 RepID=A0ABS3DUC5_9BACI|nr:MULTISPECIES: CrcB family protein [Halobacillus]MBN8234818.1 CrcB family protein [Halobacillus kuroshimensis]
MIYLYVGFGGFIGASLRYLIGLLFVNTSGFPYSTLLVNLSGSFLLAWLTAGLINKYQLAAEWKAFLGTGLIGSYTTFSALTADAFSLYEHGSEWESLLYISLSIGGGFLCSSLGYHLAGRKTR